jgi:hypothetical protein
MSLPVAAPTFGAVTAVLGQQPIAAPPLKPFADKRARGLLRDLVRNHLYWTQVRRERRPILNIAMKEPGVDATTRTAIYEGAAAPTNRAASHGVGNPARTFLPRRSQAVSCTTATLSSAFSIPAARLTPARTEIGMMCASCRLPYNKAGAPNVRLLDSCT